MFSCKKDLICTDTWDDAEIFSLIELAKQMKQDPFNKKWNSCLKNKNFLMLFYNPSLRTHLSFETAVSDLGGHPIFRSSGMGWAKKNGGITSSEALVDMANVISRYVDGVGIRISMDAVSNYGEGNIFLSEFAKFSNVPLISMGGDRFHPCQGLADMMGWGERYSKNSDEVDLKQLKGKTLLLTWGSSGFARPWASVQSHLLLAARLGMNIRLAYPKGYDLDSSVCEQTKAYCSKQGATYEVVHDPDSGYAGAHVVYVRNWITNNAYQNGKFQYELETKRSLALKDWIVTENRMNRTENAIFANPMPVDRGKEAEERVIESDRSAIYDIAENRYHIQKALLAAMIGNRR